MVRILGFNHGRIIRCPKETAYGGGHTYAGISFEYVDFIMDNIAVNSTGTNAGGWGVCPLRNTLNNTTITSISIKRAK